MGISDYLSHFLELPEVTLPKFFPIIRPIIPQPQAKTHTGTNRPRGKGSRRRENY